jgi:hypothetical protein
MSIEAMFLTNENGQELQLIKVSISGSRYVTVSKIHWKDNSIQFFATNLNLLPLLGILHSQLLIYGSTLKF